MFSKQDVVKPRTAEDLERRYNFGKTFAETSGLIAESTKTIEESNKAIAQIQRTVSDQNAELLSLTEWKGETTKNVASINQKTNANEASIKSLTEWKGETTKNVASIDQRVTDAESTIKLLTELNTGETSSLAELVTKVNANEASIKSLTEWKGDTNESIADIEQTASDQGASIKTLTEWKGEVEKDVSSIASIRQIADQNRAGVELYAKYDVNGKPTASGSLVIEAINGESSAKISADRLDIEGKELNIKVPSTNIIGTLSADRIRTGVIRSVNKNATQNNIYVWVSDTLVTQLTGVGTASEDLELSEDGKVLISLGTFDGDILVIPEGVEEIDCITGDFSTVVLPTSLTTMQANAITECYNLRDVVIKGSPAMDEWAIDYCPNLERVYITDPYMTIPDCFSGCALYYYRETNPEDYDFGNYWRYELHGLLVDLNRGKIESPTATIGDNLVLKGNNHKMTIEDDGIRLSNLDGGVVPETMQIGIDSIVAKRDAYKRFSASQDGFTTELESVYSNMPDSFYGVKNPDGSDLIGMRIGTTTALVGTDFQIVPKLEILVDGKVYMTFSNNKITIPNGITVEGI